MRLNHLPYPDTAIDITVYSPNISLIVFGRYLIVLMDHFPMILTLSTSAVPPACLTQNSTEKYKFNQNKADWALFSLVISSILPLVLSADPLETYSNFTEVVLNYATIIIPKSKTNPGFPSSPIWWNEKCPKEVKIDHVPFVFTETHIALEPFLPTKINAQLHVNSLIN